MSSDGREAPRTYRKRAAQSVRLATGAWFMKFSNATRALSAIAVTLGMLVVGKPASAVGGEDCQAFARAVQISVRKGNGTYPNAYRTHTSRGIPSSRAMEFATDDANNAFWRSLIVQSAAIADYSTDPLLFVDVYFIAMARSQDEVGNAFGRAMATCQLTLSGNYPRKRVSLRG